MTADQFHDALTLLPGELLAETDRLRNAPVKPRRIPFARYAGLAASLAVVLFCGWFVHGLFHAKGTSSADSTLMNGAVVLAPEIADAEQPESAEAAAGLSEVYPGLRLLDAIESTLPQDSAISRCSVQVISSPEDSPVELWQSEDWFDDHDLLLLHVPGSLQPPQLLSVTRENSRWIFTVTDSPSGETNWLLLLEAEKGLIAADQVDLIFAP